MQNATNGSLYNAKGAGGQKRLDEVTMHQCDCGDVERPHSGAKSERGLLNSCCYHSSLHGEVEDLSHLLLFP